MRFHWFLPTASDGRSLTVGMRGTHGPAVDTAVVVLGLLDADAATVPQLLRAAGADT